MMRRVALMRKLIYLMNDLISELAIIFCVGTALVPYFTLARQRIKKKKKRSILCEATQRYEAFVSAQIWCRVFVAFMLTVNTVMYMMILLRS